MPRLFFEVKSQEKADTIKDSIPNIVKVLERPPNTIEFYIKVNSLIEAEHAMIFLYDLPERRTSEFQGKITKNIGRITVIKDMQLVFVLKENWILREDVVARCNK